MVDEVDLAEEVAVVDLAEVVDVDEVAAAADVVDEVRNATIGPDCNIRCCPQNINYLQCTAR